MEELKGLIDNNADSAIPQNDETILKCLDFSIVGEFSTEVVNDSNFFAFHDPVPTQYAILFNKHKSLRRMLTIMIDIQKTNVLEVFNPVGVKSNVKYPLLHLAVITKSTKCLTTMIEYLNSLKTRGILSQSDYDNIIYLNCNFIHPPKSGQFYRHTALYYSLYHFESFKILCDLAKADPFREGIEEDKGATSVANANQRISPFNCLVARVHPGTAPKIMNYIKKEFSNLFEEHVTTVKYNPQTFQVDQSGGKTMKEILDSMDDTPNEDSRLTKEMLLIITKPILSSPIPTENVSDNQQIIVNTGNTRGSNHICSFSKCDQLSSVFCSICMKEFCDEHKDHENHK